MNELIFCIEDYVSEYTAILNSEHDGLLVNLLHVKEIVEVHPRAVRKAGGPLPPSVGS